MNSVLSKMLQASAVMCLSLVCGAVPSLAQSAPSATLTANGLHNITVGVGSTINYKWSSMNAASATSSYTVDGGGPSSWDANTLSGSLSGTVAASQASHVYVLTYTVTNSTGMTASDQVTITVSQQGGPNGQAEFIAIGTNSFTVPKGVTRIRAWVYGGGGGAGSSISSTSLGFNGGSGAFAEGVINVTPSTTLTITVGAGGAGGIPGGNVGLINGTAGGASEIFDQNDNVLLSAGGGGAGIGYVACVPVCGVGTGGEVGVGPAGSILRAGPDGKSCGGGQTRCGYTPPNFTADVSVGGRGFNNGTFTETQTINGVGGYVYLEW